MAAKPEGVGHGSLNLTFLRLVEGEVQFVIYIRIIIILLVVDGRRDHAFLDGQNRGDGLYGACSSEKMSSHRLSRTQAHLVGMLLEHAKDRLHLRRVSQWCGCSVHVDVVDLLRTHARILQSGFHDQNRARSFRVCRRHVVGVR